MRVSGHRSRTLSKHLFYPADAVRFVNVASQRWQREQPRPATPGAAESEL